MLPRKRKDVFRRVDHLGQRDNPGPNDGVIPPPRPGGDAAAGRYRPNELDPVSPPPKTVAVKASAHGGDLQLPHLVPIELGLTACTQLGRCRRLLTTHRQVLSVFRCPVGNDNHVSKSERVEVSLSYCIVPYEMPESRRPRIKLFDVPNGDWAQDERDPGNDPIDYPQEITRPFITRRAFSLDNVQRFTFAGAAHGAFRGDPVAGIRAGERKTR